MGICSSLFYSSNDPEKQTLHRRITPSEEQQDEQQERWNELAEYLKADLRERTGYEIRSWLQGSYKFGTQIRPVRLNDEFDIDLGIYFCWPGGPEDGRHDPSELRAFVLESLQRYAADAEDVKGEVESKRRRCRIAYEGNFHIDVPCYHLDPDRDARMLATDTGWEDSDPKALFLRFQNLFTDDHERSKARRLVRYVKAWAALRFRGEDGKPSAVLITVLVAEAVHKLMSDDLAADDDALLRALDAIVERLEDSQRVENPVNRSEDLAESLNAIEFQDFLDRLRAFRAIAERAFDSDTLLEAVEHWSTAFDHLLPWPDQAEHSLHKLPATTLTPEIAVRAVPRNNGARDRSSVNGIGPIPKGCDIYFRLVNAESFPPSATVDWMVRNEGQEAEYVNDMGHRAGNGFTAKEHSAYNGTHYMDCTVKHLGRIVGVRRVPVQIEGRAIPRRNPIRRPAYTGLRGRRR